MSCPCCSAGNSHFFYSSYGRFVLELCSSLSVIVYVCLFPNDSMSICVFQEVWACWCELLSYLEQENGFLDQLEQKLDETENLQGGAEELQEALDVSMNRRRRRRRR